MRRIICIGNRLFDHDAHGPQVYDRLIECAVDVAVQVIDGGTGGLRLLSLLEGCARVVFVDTLCGFAEAGATRELPLEQVVAMAGQTFDHAAGLPYLLRVLPAVIEGPLPSIGVLGIERGASSEQLDHAALRALELVLTTPDESDAARPARHTLGEPS